MADETATPAGGFSLPLLGREGARLVATILPLSRGQRQNLCGPFAATAAIFVQDPVMVPPFPGEAFAKLYGLTGSELRVLLAMTPGLSVKEAAEVLGVSETTAKTHLQHIYAKNTFLLSPVSDDPNAADGSVAWNYTLDNEAAQYLKAGETVTETYTVTIADGNGSVVIQNVVITIIGIGESPTIERLTMTPVSETLNEISGNGFYIVYQTVGPLADLDVAWMDIQTGEVKSLTLVGSSLMVRARLQRVGREMKMLVENTDDQSKADPAMLRIVARAHDIQERLMQKSGLTLHAIASQEHVTPGYISRLLRLASLAPDIITAIVNGKNPPQLTAKKLMRLALEIPVDWTAQRKLLGFHAR